MDMTLYKAPTHTHTHTHTQTDRQTHKQTDAQTDTHTCTHTHTHSTTLLLPCAHTLTLTWCINKVNPVFAPVEGHCRRCDGDPSFTFLSQVVCHGATVIHICTVTEHITHTYRCFCSLNHMDLVACLTIYMHVCVLLNPTPLYMCVFVSCSTPTRCICVAALLTPKPPRNSSIIQHSLCCGCLACIYVGHNANVSYSAHNICTCTQ